MDVIHIEGVTPSAELRQELAGQEVLLAFSRGKDSIAAWLALREAGVRVIPYHLHLIPGLAFVEESLRYFEDFFETPILDLPHPSLYRWLNNLMFQPPDRCATIEAAAIPVPTYRDVDDLVCEHHALPKDTWVCDGVRAADSPMRRIALKTHGPKNHNARKIKAVWDWRKAHVFEAIETAGIELPPDYAWFNRSFDGLDLRFLRPLCEHAPEDYAIVRDWFPLVDLEFARAALT